MAFAAQLAGLTDELVQSISNESDPSRLSALRETSLRQLRHHTFLRTNQFDVENRLQGLEERFRVMNREALADALQSRLEALSALPQKWTPEALFLLLELSDKPVQKSRLSDLDALKSSDEEEGPPLTWAEIAKEDGWREERDLWRTVDFADHSSEDELLEDAPSESSGRSDDTAVSSIEARFRKTAVDLIADAEDKALLQEVQQSQVWRIKVTADKSQKKTTITEAQAVREALLMLRGLKNDIFDGSLKSISTYQLRHATTQSYGEVLGSLASIGKQLLVLREFPCRVVNTPLQQVFQNAIAKRLQSFDESISNMEARFVDVKQQTVISLASLLDSVKLLMQPLAPLSSILNYIHKENQPTSFRYLELLFQAVEMAQMAGNDKEYAFLGALFFECFQVYLRPIRAWMDDGELAIGDDTFFVVSTNTQVPMSSLWREQFELRRTADDALFAPRFLKPAVSKIFTTGKSVVVLRFLGKYGLVASPGREPALEFDDQWATGFNTLTPFSEVFNSCFERWMQSKHHTASDTLRRVLFETCKLPSVLDALHRIFLMSDASCSDLFAFHLFKNIDLLNERWHDRYSMTETIQEAFGPVIEESRIKAMAANLGPDDHVNTVRQSVRKGLPLVQVSYQLPWPLRLIISEDDMKRYQSVFTLLLQLKRATYVLQKHRLLSDGISAMDRDRARYYSLRSVLLWYCTTIQTYLSTTAIDPLFKTLREDIHSAEDVDAMISRHSAFTKRLVDEACLGDKLKLIHQCILDVLDLVLELEEAHQSQAKRSQGSDDPGSIAPPATPSTKRYTELNEEEDDTFLSEQDSRRLSRKRAETYYETLARIRSDFSRHLKFICGGLRGVARASGNAAASKWDMLAEMLEQGIQKERDMTII